MPDWNALSHQHRCPVTTINWLDRVGEHNCSLQLPLCCFGSSITMQRMTKMLQPTPLNFYHASDHASSHLYTHTHMHARAHGHRPRSNSNILSALSAFFCGPAKTKVLTMEEWDIVVSVFSVLTSNLISLLTCVERKLSPYHKYSSAENSNFI